MGWDSSRLPWREFERRLSWGKSGGDGGDGRDGPGATVRRLPVRRPGRPARPGRPGETERPARPGRGRQPAGPAWAELHCHSSYSFLDGASSPEDLVAEAAATVFGAELSLDLPGGQGGVPDPVGQHLLVLARDPDGYRRLCRVISAAQLRGGEKGRPVYDLAELAQAHDGHWMILTGCRKGAVPAALAAGGPGAAAKELGALADLFGGQNLLVELTGHDQPDDDERNDALFELGRRTGTPVIATGNVHHASPKDARLAQALAAIRARRSLDEMDGWLAASGAAYLRSGAEMEHRLRRYRGCGSAPSPSRRTARSTST
jgi:error-prone DNA polymerase